MSSIAKECRVVAIASVVGVFLLMLIPDQTNSSPHVQRIGNVLMEAMAIAYSPVGSVIGSALGLLPGKGYLIGMLWMLITVPVQNVLTWLLVRYVTDRWIARRRATPGGN
jgi:uncharacterized membrane protein